MSIRFRCKKCNQKYELDDDCSGDNLDCIRCKTPMVVPQKSEIPQKADELTGFTPVIDEKDKIQEIKIASSTAKNKAPDDIIFRCKICNQKYRLPKSIGGQIAECAKCKKNMIVPKQSDGAPATSETVLFWCKSCGQKYRLPKEIAGEEGECSRCHNTFVVPGKSEERAPVPESRKAIEKATAIASFIPVVDKNKDKIQKISVHSTTLKNKSPDDIIFRCKVCNQKYRLPKGLGGQLAECAKCKKNMVVPRQSDGQPASTNPQENVTFWCKSCGQKYRLPKELAGQEGECTRCNKIFEVPPESETKRPEIKPDAAEKQGIPAQINLQTPDQGKKRFESRGDLPTPPQHFLSKTPASKKPETATSAKPATIPPVITKSPPNKHPERDAEKTQTSIAVTKTARTMVKYVLEIPERNFFFVSFSLIIDWLMQITMFCRMPRKLVIFLLIFTTSLAMLITYSGIKMYERSVKGGIQVNVMCASCKLRETRPVNNIFTAKCSKCNGALGFQWKCNYCSGVFTRIEKKTEDNPIQYDKIDALKPPVCPFCNSTAVKYLAPPKPEPPGQPKKINIRKNRN